MSLQPLQRFFFLFIALASAAAQAGQFETGLIFATEEELSSLPSVPRYRAYLPESVDLSARFPRAGFQGNQGSCVGWAVAYGARSYYDFKLSERTPDSKWAFSPAFIYNLIEDRDSKCQSGSSIYKALSLVRDQGVPRMSDFPYSDTNCTRKPSDVVMSRASQYKILGFKRINDTEGVKGELYRGHPVIVGMMVSDSFENLQGKIVYNDEQSQPTGGHAMVITGYDDKRRAFRVFNSWGPYWGENGFGWVGYQAMAKRGREFYTMEVARAPEPVPEPPAPPPPVPEPPPAPPPTPPKVKQQDVQEITDNVQCGSVKAQLSTKGEISLSGFAGDQRAIDSVIEKLQALQGVGTVTAKVQIRPWPLCEAMKTLEMTTLNPNRLSLSLAGSTSAILKGGQKLSFNVQLKTTEAYLYLDYLQVNGEAVSLERGQRVTGTKAIRLPPGGKQFVVQAPYGAELLVAIMSPKPLFDAGVKYENDREYLSALRQALLGLSAAERSAVVSSTISIKTSED
jgi:hypothetical protein